MNRDPLPEQRDPTPRVADPEWRNPVFLHKCECGTLFRTNNPARKKCLKCRTKES